MKKHRCLVCGLLVGITIPHFTASAEIAKPNSTTAPAASSVPHKTNGQSPRNIEEECEAEWRADKEGMMKRGLTEDRYVEQCSVKDDVPTIPSENGAPSVAPNRPPARER
jgi:hypothetical protein